MKIAKITLLMILCAAATPVDATDRVLLAPGVTGAGGATAGVGLVLDWNRRWFESNTGYLGGYWHAGYTWWEAGRFNANAHTASFSPVLVYRFHSEHWRPFIEAGVGAAWFSRSRVGNRNLGSTLHFEDRLGAGVYLGSRDMLMLRVVHYSNAGLSPPNQGINAWSLVWGRSF